MAQIQVIREGRVVERDGLAVVRFRAGCQGSGPCACVPGGGEHDVAMAALGLNPVASAGQRVTVALSAAALSRLAWRLFGLPLAALVGGACVGELLAGQQGLSRELVSAGLGLGALVVTLILVTRRSGAMVRSLTVTAHLQRTDT